MSICLLCGAETEDGRFHLCAVKQDMSSWRNYIPPPLYKAYNKFIATEPWPEDEQKPKAVATSGFAVVKNKAALKGLKVMVGNNEYVEGSTVFVRAELYTHGFAKEVFEVDGKRMILLPVEHILFARYGEPLPDTVSITHPKDPSAL